MKGMREIRNRIKAVQGTGKITHAMELVAASKMKKAQRNAESGREYALLLMKITRLVAKKLGGLFRADSPAQNTTAFAANGRRLIIVLSTDRGLCGALNTNLFKAVAEIGDNADFIAVGSRAARFLAKTKRPLKGTFKLGDSASFLETRKIVSFATKLAKDSPNLYTSLEVLYPLYVNTLRQEPVLVKVAPVNDLDVFMARLKKVYKIEDSSEEFENSDLIELEPSAEDILADLPAFYINQIIHLFALDAKASEQSARMVAMKAASENADSLVAELNLEYNKARQNAITTEILELSAGAAKADDNLGY